MTSTTISILKPDNLELDSVTSPVSSKGSTIDSVDSFNMNLDTKTSNTNKPYTFSAKSTLLWKVVFAIFGVCVMFFARFSVPDNPVTGIEDKVLNAFQGLNDWIHLDHNAFFRSAMLFLCATQLDIIFFATLIYWALYGKTGRLPLSLAIFYLTRAIVQALWWSPYPAGYYWDSPGFPSFVAPYGRGTDFFFSGHSGFLVLMANEWHRWGNKKMRNYVLLSLVYTIFILMVYQAHYSIDVFTGVFFADYVFGKVDANKESVDGFFVRICYTVQKFFEKGKCRTNIIKTSLSKKNN